MPIYNGFSSSRFNYDKSFLLSNVDVIRQDILNNIYTRRGERVKMFTYGTRIPDLIFEPLDDISVYIVQEDLETVFNNDPRLQLIDLKVIPDYFNQVIVAYAEVYYTYLNFNGQMAINIQFSSGNNS